MKRKFLRSWVVALTPALFFAVSCQKEQVRVVSLQGDDARRVGIGFIENRDIRYSPFSSKNFSDMLRFELMQYGYRLRDVDYAKLDQASNATNPGSGADTVLQPDAESQATQNKAEDSEQPSESSGVDLDQARIGPEIEQAAVVKEDTPREEETYADSILPEKTVAAKEQEENQSIDPASINDGTRDLLPRRLRNIAGELEPRQRVIEPENRPLTEKEVARLAQSNDLDYYIQGAIGRTETGLILETEENTLVFLEVFGPNGERVGAINISINDETLKRSSFLQQISAEIVEAFAREIGN